MLAGDGACRSRSPSRPQPLASRSLSDRRDRHARRRLHLQRHSRPQARRSGRAHPQSPVAVGAGNDSRRGGAPCRSGAGRPRGASVLQPILDLARNRLAWRRRRLPADEARDLMAASRARPRLLVGGADGLERDFRESRACAHPAVRVRVYVDDRLRHDLCAPGRARRRDCRHPLDRPPVRLARHARRRGVLCRDRGAGAGGDRSRGRGRNRADRLGRLCSASRLAGARKSRARTRRRRSDSFAPTATPGSFYSPASRCRGGWGRSARRRFRRSCRRRPSGSRR